MVIMRAAYLRDGVRSVRTPLYVGGSFAYSLNLPG